MKITIKTAVCVAITALSMNVFAAKKVTLTMLVDNTVDTMRTADALTKAYMKLNPNIEFEIETRPGGGEGDNIVKTRLATDEMTDLFAYNSGSLLQALKPSRTIVPINDMENYGNINASFVQGVSDKSGNTYGVPFGTAMGGGILYNIPVYEKLGLEIPTTWAGFMENNRIIAEKTDIAPVAQTYRDTWTSQVFVLADYYNVQADYPNFAVDYTNNKVKYATNPAAKKGFERLQEVYESGFMNKDFGAATYSDGLRMISTGEAAHYPMLTFALSAIMQDHPDHLQDVGFFAQPGDSAANNGMTVWLPAGMYIYKGSKHKKEAMAFSNFVATVDACNAHMKDNGVTGPYMVKGCDLPDDVAPMLKGIMSYMNEDGKTAPALEFLSPIKGPMLEQITVEVGTGIRSAADAAVLYDKDVKKQAKQLGLANW